MADYHRRRIVAAVVTLTVFAAGICSILISVSNQPPAEPPNQKRQSANPDLGISGREIPPPPLSSSPYLNTKLDVTYVGSDACRECHADQFESFSRTPHSRSLGPVDLAEQPPDVDFEHPKSQRRFRVSRKDGRLVHRESLVDGDKPEFVLGDFSVAYEIGSGHHSRSYLVDFEGFLVESPLTWYASKQEWGLSPGYDIVNWGFTRPAREECIHCHAGRVEAVDGTTHRLAFREQRIGCESCHGPGLRHIQDRRDTVKPSPDIDHSIVNPHHLSRELNESVCARCHLRGEAFVAVRSRHQNDFRPGLPLTDFRIDYQAEHPAKSMTVVGHFQQMHQSSCYRQSNTMTCTTCHNPHDSPPAPQKAAYYRDKCLSCHAETGGCQLDETKRLAKNPQNDCVSCHMPKADTDIPHFAFTHHRIAVEHSPHNRNPSNEIVELVPFNDVSRFSEIEQARGLGLADLEFADRVSPQMRSAYLQRATARLRSVHAGGLRDATVLAALARLHWEEDSRQCISFAEAALKSPDRSAVSNVNALIVLGDMHLRLGDHQAATQAFTQLTTIRRWPDDWKMLGTSLMQAKDFPGAARAYTRAVDIRPADFDLRLLLADALEESGKHELAKQQRDLANRLRKP
ncbi:MAG: tetratricopeptide repeat protein [Planctomycetota bacterium]|nr:tetratricopeptide repeat protein [Planctomycetota bacterium]